MQVFEDLYIDVKFVMFFYIYIYIHNYFYTLFLACGEKFSVLVNFRKLWEPGSKAWVSIPKQHMSVIDKLQI